MKNTTEIERIFITYDISDLRDGIGGGFQQHLRICDTDRDNVLHGSGPGILLEIADKPTDTHPAGRGIVFDAKVQIIMVVEILSCQIHFPFQVFVFACVLPGKPAVYEDQEMPEQHGQHFLVVGLTVLQFGDHSFKQPFVLQGSAGVKYAHIIPDPVTSQDIRHIAAGEMYPVYLCLVCSIVFVFLKFFRTVKNHIAGRDNGVIFCMIKVEMCNAGGNIQNLKIQSSTGTVGGKLWAVIKAISAAASYNQRFCLIFEVYERIIEISCVHIHIQFLRFYLYHIILCRFCLIGFIDFVKKNLYNNIRTRKEDERLFETKQKRK